MPDAPPAFDPLSIVYTFMLDEGEVKMTYKQYLENAELRKRVNDRHHFSRIVMGRRIIVMSRKRLSSSKQIRETFNEVARLKRENGVMHFAPNGPGATDFLNDWDCDVKICMAGNQRGKTATGIIDDILDVIPLDPKWPIFAEYGVKWRPWRGPVILTILTYQWTHQQAVVWPRLKEWLPRYELDDYFSRRKTLRWEKNQHLELTCGSVINMRVYSQDQEVFEGPTWMRAHWDEQGTETIFDAVDERIATQGWKPTHIFTLTPHEVEGRPDTGGGSWIEKMITGVNSKAKEVHQYNIAPDDVPDWIYPEDEKEKKFRKWIKEPLERGDFSTYREGRSRYYGEWHVGSGLVYDEWTREAHMIDPFPIPYDWTKYRALDHGTRNPTACLYAAVSDRGDLFIYDEYYAAGKGIDENVNAIIEQAGNSRSVVERYTDAYNRNVVCFEERFDGTVFQQTVMDPRSFSSPDPSSNMNLGQLYRRAGLAVRQAPAQNSENRIPRVKEWLKVDYTKKHPVTGKMGRPKVYVFSTCTNFVREIESRRWKKVQRKNDETPVEVPEKKDDHTQNAFEYLIFTPPRYFPPTGRRDKTSIQPRKVTNVRTKY